VRQRVSDVTDPLLNTERERGRERERINGSSLDEPIAHLLEQGRCDKIAGGCARQPDENCLFINFGAERNDSLSREFVQTL